MNVLYYLLEANLYLVVFFAFYMVFLRGETFYNRNRIYLVGASFLAFLIPILEIGLLKPIIPIAEAQILNPADFYQMDLQTIPLQNTPEPFSLTDFIIPIYGMVAVLFILKLVHGIGKIISIYRKANKYQDGKTTVVELHGNQTAFSFMNWLFINPKIEPQDLIFKHELIHIKQKHTWDVLFFEILQSICWFNPIIVLIKKEVKVLHEYIADELATSATNNKHEYAMILIENSLNYHSYQLVNQFFNQSILKRRILMLNKEKTRGWARLKIALALPLVGGMLCTSTMAFTDKTYGLWDLAPREVALQDSLQKVWTEVDLAKKGFYSPNYTYDKNDQYKSLEKRLIVVNGVPVADNNQFYGGSKADKIVFLKPKESVLKYGERAKHGAVEISGNNIEFNARYVISDTLKYPAPKPTQSLPSLTPVNKENQNKFPTSSYKTGKNIDLPPTVNYTVNRAKHETLVIKDITEDKTLTVHDRWGNVVYNSSNYKDNWDGKLGNFEDFMGKKIKSGSYYYIVKVLDDPTKNTRGYILFTNGESEYEKKSALKPSNDVYYASAITDTKNKLEEITVVGRPSGKVQSIQIEPRNNDDLKEITVKGYPSKAYQGKPMAPINGNGKIKEITIKGKPIQKVQGKPLNGTGEIKEIEIKAKKKRDPEEIIYGDPIPGT